MYRGRPDGFSSFLKMFDEAARNRKLLKSQRRNELVGLLAIGNFDSISFPSAQGDVNVCIFSDLSNTVAQASNYSASK